MDKASALEFSVRFRKPFRFVDFDTKVLKRSFRKIGHEFPGMSTGKLRSSIKYRVSHSGFSVGVANYMTNSIRERGAYYPAFVYWGHRAPGADRNALRKPDRRQQHKKRHGEKVAAPRKNWIVEAANQYGNEAYQKDMAEILDEALKPGIISG